MSWSEAGSWATFSVHKFTENEALAAAGLPLPLRGLYFFKEYLIRRAVPLTSVLLRQEWLQRHSSGESKHMAGLSESLVHSATSLKNQRGKYDPPAAPAAAGEVVSLPERGKLYTHRRNAGV